MCKVKDGHNYSKDAAQELPVITDRDGIMERRGGMDAGNGKGWEVLSKLLSIVMIPWASAVMWLLLGMAKDMTELKTQFIDMERRITNIERQVDPENRFYRRDGDLLDERIDTLEGLHPRGPAE